MYKEDFSLRREVAGTIALALVLIGVVSFYWIQSDKLVQRYDHAAASGVVSK